MNPLQELTKIAKDHNIEALVRNVLAQPAFAICSGSGDPKHHHYGDGGLAKHTHEVTTFCIATYAAMSIIEEGKPNFRPFNLEETLVAAFWHDFGKIWDYQKDPDGNWGKFNDHARKIGHISRSVMEFDRIVLEMSTEDHATIFGRVNINDIRHCILSHHGCREWGSPVSPATKEAWVLHLSDMLSARLDDCNRYDKF